MWSRSLARPRPKTATFAAGVLAASAVLLLGASPVSADGGSCLDGGSPALQSTVNCDSPGNYTITVPTGTTSVDLDAIGGGGGAGYPARQHIGGNAAEATGTLTLPNGTTYVYVIVGAAGTGDNHGTSTGGGASAVIAEDSEHDILAKVAIAGGGGGGAYNGDGGDAGSQGTSDNAQAVSGPGQPGVGSEGGAGGSGNYAPGTSGGSDNAAAAAVAGGGSGGAVPGGATGGGGGGGYGGGGGGGGSRGSILSSNVAGGGGGSSLASSYLGSASIAIAAETGGIQLPGLVASDGATGSVAMTFNGVTVPGVPTDVVATPGNGQASVAFTAPVSDGGSVITGYTATSSPGGFTGTCSSSPCVVTGLTDGTPYTFTVHATNTNGSSAESDPSSAVTPALVPGAPTAVSATPGNAQASVAFTAPVSNGGSAITGYTATSSPGGFTGTCSSSPCVVTGLTNGTSYTFTVHAINVIGDSTESTASAPVTPVTVPGAPADPVATPGDGQASVSFTLPASSGGSAITGYSVTSSPDGIVAGCTGSPCVITGLTNGTSYTFTVHATNAVGDSTESASTAAVTPAALPGAPTDVTATPSSGQASVAFTAPVSDGGSTITGYTATSSPGGFTGTCSTSPCIVTGLTNGTAYTFTVHATNAIGDSTESTASAQVTPIGVPAAPSAVSVTAGDESAQVSFTAPSNGGSAITGYEYSSDNGVSWHALTASGSSGPLTGTITGLTNGTTYQVKVRAVNAVGNGTASSAHSVTPGTVPGAPSGVSAVGGAGQATVSFSAPASDGGVAITGYTATSSPGGITGTCSSSPCVVTGLTNGTSYTFTVHATNSFGDSVESSPSSAVTPATVPGAPTSLVVTGGDSLAHVSFTAPSNGGSAITGYEYSSDNGVSWHALTASGSAPITGTITGLTNGTTYQVKVRAVNAVGNGTASAAASVTPGSVPGAPTGVSAVGGAGQATVLFTAPGSNGGVAITGYTATSSPGGLTGTCSTSPCVVTGLTNGTSYTFTVHATDAVGDSVESSPSAAVVPMAAPAAPTGLAGTTTDTTLTVTFSAPDANGSAITGYEISTDNGVTWVTLSTSASGSDLTGTVMGLTASTTYQVKVRAINGVGTGPATAAVAATTVPTALAAPTATAGTASVTVSWTASGDSTVTGYTVIASPGPATCTTTSISDTSCVIGATSGVDYTYVVIAHSPAGDSAASPASTPVSAAEPTVPAEAPTSAATTLTTTDGVLATVDPGQTITIVGTGFLPHSTVTILLYSSPIVLGDAIADASGNVRQQVTLPDILLTGDHNLVASGVDPSGASHVIRMAVTYTAAVTPGTTTTGSGTTTEAGATAGTLPFTGLPLLQLAIWAILATALGTALFIGGRHRRSSTH
jgi:hypothetical protein